jgi:hypothetical protein
MPILNFDSRFGGRSLPEHAARNPSSLGDLTLPVAQIAAGPPVEAQVNHGRWVAECSAAGCGGAEFVSLNEPLFFCCECRNVAVGHKLIQVTVPGNHDELEQLLMGRSVGARNWRAPETPADLERENRGC